MLRVGAGGDLIKKSGTLRPESSIIDYIIGILVLKTYLITFICFIYYDLVLQEVLPKRYSTLTTDKECWFIFPRYFTPTIFTATRKTVMYNQASYQLTNCMCTT